MLMVVAGLCYSYFTSQNTEVALTLEPYQLLIELTLALILFNDAANAKLSILKLSYRYPLRLLLIGLPLSFILGTGLSVFLLTELSFVESALLAIILTPTDAALSSDFLKNKQISEPIREAVNVESGLNDGLAVPIFVLLLFVYVQGQTVSIADASFLIAEEIGIALGVSVLLSPLIFKLVLACEQKRIVNKEIQAFICIPVALFIYLITQLMGGSGFFATFITGLLFDYKYKSKFKPQRLNDSHIFSSICALIVWFLFGIFAYSYLRNGVSLQAVVYALCALTVMRFLPVLIATAWSDLSLKRRFILAWFGPRGLASVVFTLILINEHQAVPELLIESAIVTILLSVFAHGMSSRLNLD
jgi:NhaP-type Na+/H+ or K+/H+ antiporter